MIAPCVENPGDWFKDSRNASPDQVALCEQCPAKAPCQQLGAGERFGVWGGTVPLDTVRCETRARVKALRLAGLEVCLNAHKIPADAERVEIIPGTWLPRCPTCELLRSQLTDLLDNH